MALQAEKAANEYSIECDMSTRHHYDAVTLFAESLDGGMRTPTPYTFNGYELYATDGGRLSKMLQKGIDQARAMVAQKSNLQFELRRRLIEYEEYQDMLRLCRGELVDTNGTIANTMVVTSDFPPELMHITQDVGGYNASRKQTMLRVITWDTQGLHMFTQTLDGSNRMALEEIHKSFGNEPDPEKAELLGERIYAHVPLEQQPYTVDRITGIYDRSLSAQFGGRWREGRRQRLDEPERNTYEFSCQQHDLIDTYVSHKIQGTYDDTLQYNLLALLEERFERNVAVTVETSLGAVAMHACYDPLQLAQELNRAGNNARAEGKTFSACGSSLGPDGVLNSDQQLEADGYGNRTSAETSYKFDKKMYCVVCQAPPKKQEPKKMCGPCGICKGCDTKLSKKA